MAGLPSARPLWIAAEPAQWEVIGGSARGRLRGVVTMIGPSPRIAAAHRYLTIMITDPELAAAVEGREYWRPLGEDSAVYEVPGMPASVRVSRIRRPPIEGPTRHHRYVATVTREGRALHATPFGFAHAAVEWAEHVRLS